MKNIVFFIQDFSRSAGSERVTSIIANALSENGYNVTILSVCGKNISFYPINPKIKLVTLIEKETVDNKKSFFKIYSALKKYYSENEVDLVIDIFASLSIYTLLLKRKFHYKNITWEHFNFKANVGLNKYGRRLAAKKSNVIVTLTEKDELYYRSALKKMKASITHIYNPTPYENVDLSHQAREKIVISVGRLTYQKGFDVMLDIWGQIEKKAANWRLLIIGEGEDKSKLCDQIKKLGLKNVEIVPATDKIDCYYKKSKIYLSTARFEGLPMTMIEAQSFGLPIVSFDYDTGPSDIITTGKNGFLIENGNKADLCEALIGLMQGEKLLMELSENSLDNAKRFLRAEIVDKWLQLVREQIS